MNLQKTLHTIKQLLQGTDTTFVLTEEIKNAFTLLEDSTQSLFITGKAGTGKSLFIQYVRNVTKKKCIVLAPTGLAAINIKGQTIHSFFHFPPHILTPETNLRTVNSRIYRDIDCIIIDEISMVRADVLDAIDRFLRKNGKDKNIPFGGIQMIFVGDLFQLSPIVTAEDASLFHSLYESPFFFSAKCFSQLNCKTIEFTQIFRQKDAEFIQILNAIRSGSFTSDQLALLNQRVIPEGERKNTDRIILTTTKSSAQTINTSKLLQLSRPKKVFTATIEGIFPQEHSHPVDIALELKIGAKVLFIKNDKAGRWVNGTIGIIQAFDADAIRVKIVHTEKNEQVSVVPQVWENIKYEYNNDTGEIIPCVIGTLTQYPLKLAYALTIHKSQGMTFTQVQIDFSKSPFTHGQTYVALSRCVSLSGLYLSKRIFPNDIIIDDRIHSFIQETRFSRHSPETINSHGQQELIKEITK